MSVIGTVIGVVIFLMVVADAFDESFSTETTAEAPDDAEGESAEGAAEPEDEAEEPEEEGGAEVEGTRENPHPLGTEVSSGDWTVTVNSVDLEATDEVMAENQFNEAPEDGQTYILVNITAEYVGSDAEGDMPWASVEYVSPEGNTFTEGDALIVAPDAFDSSPPSTRALPRPGTSPFRSPRTTWTPECWLSPPTCSATPSSSQSADPSESDGSPSGVGGVGLLPFYPEGMSSPRRPRPRWPVVASWWPRSSVCFCSPW
ncbi:DUF4352 domain-containing protein [Nesterenkonia pannonica]|uniref:DUF4352 domain-containing protein n=1 Tax=Nesterenkonia pannonica TaxID=1548602 RepID=UPI002164D71E|nr:DUF4352 domain-containing protein [Nesterenkonia pannonica]